VSADNETDPFQELADAEARAGANAVDEATRAERQRCSAVLEEALAQATLRGLPEISPVVRILSKIKHEIDNP
jgi:hypothetical protein